MVTLLWQPYGTHKYDTWAKLNFLGWKCGMYSQRSALNGISRLYIYLQNSNVYARKKSGLI